MGQSIVTAPDGTRYRVTHPDNATPEQIQAQVAQQHKPSVWQQLARETAATLGQVANGAMSLPDTLAAGGEAVTNGLTGLLNRGVTSGLRAAGMPGAAATANRLLQPSHAPGFAERMNNIAPPMSSPVAAVGANLLGGMLVPMGPKATPPTSLPRAITQPKPSVSSAFGDAAAQRFANFQKAGVPNPTTGMVTRDPYMWTRERQLAKVAIPDKAGIPLGQRMNDQFQNVNDALHQGTQALVGSPTPVNPESTGMAVQRALQAKDAALKANVDNLYTQARAEGGNYHIPALDNLKQAQEHPAWADNADFDSMVASVNKRLARYKGQNGGQNGITLNQAEELRKFTGGLQPDSQQAFAMRKVLQNGIDADVFDHVDSNPFQQARAAAEARFNEFRDSLPGKIVMEQLPPEQITRRIMAAPLDDQRALMASLATGAPEHAAINQNAIGALRQQALSDTLFPHITSDGTNTTVNGKKMFDTVTAKQPALANLLDPDTLDKVNSYAQAARDATYNPPANMINFSNTATTNQSPANLAGMFPDVSGSPPRTLAQQAVRHGLRLAAGGAGGALVGHPGVGAMLADAAGTSLDNALASRNQTKMMEALGNQIGLAGDPNAAAIHINQLLIEQRKQAMLADLASRYGLPNVTPYLPGMTAAAANDLAPLLNRSLTPPLAADPNNNR